MGLRRELTQVEARGVPTGWHDCDISDLCQLQRGFDLTQATSKPGTVPVYSSSGISYFHDAAKLQPPAVITGRKGQLGRVFFVEEPCWPHDTTLWVSDFKGNHPHFVSIFLGAFRLERFDAATSVPTLNRNNLVGHPIRIPPFPEQRAIAAVFSDLDALLVGLTQLIAKKCDLKQAVMQQLLTGQTRLPGFQDEWTVKRLGDHVTFLRHGVNSRAELTVDGPVKYLHYGDVHACTGVLLAPDALPSLPSEKANTLDRLRDGDLIFADASEDLAGVSKSVEICGVGSTALVAGLHTIAARFDKDILADGFKAYLQFIPAFVGQLRRLAAGTKVYATNRAHIASIEMSLPGADEQTAISSVLHDMSAEIEALEDRRDKTRALKQAMMQELLTGKTRLVEPASASEAAC
jgi:type I restriction enzyme S subunit